MAKVKFNRIVAAVILVCLGVHRGALARDFQKAADRAQWKWRAEEASVLDAAAFVDEGYDVSLLLTHDRPHHIKISILADGRVIYSWDGHPASVFRIANGHLYYADFAQGGSGGAIVAVDLKSGKEMWRSQLMALGQFSHSIYSNQMNLTLVDDGIVIFGNETRGRYIEIKDPVTGNTLGHRVFAPTDLPEKERK